MTIKRQRAADSGQRIGAAAPQLFLRATVFCLLSSVLCPLYAEDLPDPTRPPAFIAGTATATGQRASVSDSSGLRSTIISESRRAAIIDGKTVELGAKHGNAWLIEVNEGSVVLQTAQTRRLLTLFPGVQLTQRVSKSDQTLPANEVQPVETSTMPVAPEEKK